MLSKSSIPKIFSLLVIGRLFLKILFENIPFPISPYYFITIGWTISLLLFYPKILLSKYLISVYFFVVYFITLTEFGVYTIEYNRFVERFIVPLFLSISIFQFYYQTKDNRGLTYLTIISLIFITITAITTIIGLISFPMAARTMAGSLQRAGEFELVDKYQKMGIATFSFFSALTFLFPILIKKYKDGWGIKWKNNLYIVALFILMYSFIKAQYTTALVFVLVGSLFAFFSVKNRGQAFFVAFIIGVLFLIIPSSFIYSLIADIAETSGSSFLQERIYDLQSFMDDSEVGSEASTHIGAKLSRVPILIDSFLNNILFGSGFGLGHNFWFDWLSKFGFIGLIPWLIILKQQISFNLRRLSKENRYYYVLSMSTFILYGFVNNTGGSHVFIIIFFLVPGLLYMQNGKKIKS